MSDPILAIRGLRQPPRPPHDGGIEADALLLHAGDIAVVQLDRETARPPLADLAMGLLEPAEGDVVFAGRRWAERTPDEQVQARHRIGCVFDGPGSSWVSNLDLDENVTLPLRYHGGPLTEQTWSRIEKVARATSCWPLTDSRPVVTPRDTLKRLEWVRALSVMPDLLLLERPLRDVHGDTKAFLDLVREEAKRGAAILWMTTTEREWHDVGEFASIRLRMQGGRLEKVENG